MRVLSLLKHIGVESIKFNHKIENITDSSKSCTYNSIFVAVKGNRTNGFKYISDAIGNGAKTIILEDKIEQVKGINYIYVDNSKRILAVLQYYFNYKYFKMIKLIGVIGTNGKSTTAHNIYSFLNHFNIPASLIGTDGFYLKGKILKHNNTTPNICITYEYIKESLRNKIKYIVMEASSIAIAELRCHMITFDYLVFTNFSEDHLDYHKTLDNYFINKLIPFIELKHNAIAIINKDDERYNDLIKHIKGRVISYSIDKPSDYQAKILSLSTEGISFKVIDSYYKYNSIGIFNIYNLMPLFYFKDILKIDKDDFKKYILNSKPPKGRMDTIRYKDSFIIVDYAHTEAGVKNILDTVTRMAHNKIYVVIGCGGNREIDKREKIGRILSDKNVEIILTNDNPRFENPMQIIKDIAKGISIPYKIIENRKNAIEYGIKKLCPLDYLLVIGKGNEGYIEINGNKITYNDYDVINDIIKQ